MDTEYSANYRPLAGGARSESSARGSSVRSYCCKKDTNQRFRPYMEDDCTVIDPYLNDPSTGFFAVYDGHGGSEAVEYCNSRMHEELKKAMNDRTEPPSAFLKCFLKVDDQLRLTGAVTSGCTATVVLIRREGTQRRLYSANVGDSKAVLVGPSGVQVLTYDHRGSDPSEIDRVINSGGFIMRGRVAGQLAVSRALGDHHLKSVGVIAEPYVQSVTLTNEQLLIIASDGLWDSVNEAELTSFLGKTSEQVATELVAKALDCGSRDNVCVLAVCL